MIRVVCAVIKYGEKILVVQRGEQMKLPLKWEFPGGKIEGDESEEECIRREIKEELNIEITILKRLTPIFFQYPSITIELIPFLANYKSGSITLNEHKQYRLLNKEQLSSLDWADADLPIVKEIILI